MPVLISISPGIVCGISISVLLQDNGTDAATVAGILGHTTTKYVHTTYQRYKIDSAVKAIGTLPS